VVLGHEASNTGHGGVFSEAGHLAVRFHSVVFEGLLGNGLVDALHLLGLGVDLLFALLSAPTETQHQVQRGFFLDIVIAQRSAIFELFTGKDEALLIRRNSLLVLDLSFHIVDGVAGLHIECDGLAREGLDENLHDSVVVGLFQSTPIGTQQLVKARLGRKVDREARAVKRHSSGGTIEGSEF